jgi:outer membrane immunogenic protein
MKKTLLFVTASILALGAAVPALAADLPARVYTKAPPVVAAAYDWSGFYAGINGGGGWAHSCWSVVGGLSEGCHNADGGTVGGQLGYRWQMGPIVFGVEAQGNWADISGSNVSQLFLADRNQTKIDAFGLFTGQVGYSWNNVLLYAKGGAAVVDDKYTVFGIPSGLQLATASETRWGGVIGAGFEYGFAPNWSAGLEYDHIFLGTNGNTLVTPVGALFNAENIKQDVDLFTARVNYRFGGPVMSRY